MPQWFLIVNIDKREYLHPHELGMSMELRSICTSKGIGALPYLLRDSDAFEGTEDVPAESVLDKRRRFPFAGRWANNSIVIVGNKDSLNLFDEVRAEYVAKNEQIPYRDITLKVRKEYEKFIGEKLDARLDK